MGFAASPVSPWPLPSLEETSVREEGLSAQGVVSLSLKVCQLTANVSRLVFFPWAIWTLYSVLKSEPESLRLEESQQISTLMHRLVQQTNVSNPTLKIRVFNPT